MCYQPKNCKEITQEDFHSLPGVENLKKELRISFKDLNSLPSNLWEYRKFIINKGDFIWNEKYNSLIDKSGVSNCFKINLEGEIENV